MLTGSQFVAEFARRGLPSWEAAALSLARSEPPGLTPHPFVPLELVDSSGNSATLSVMSDALSIGPLEDFVRLPLLPQTAQSICNLYGWLLPTPLLVFKRWQQSPVKLDPLNPQFPLTMQPNLGANLLQYKAQSDRVNEAIGGRQGMVSGAKKSIVVSNIYQPKKVLIWGWYQPTPDLFTNRLPMSSSARQPLQPLSNVHGDFYVDYSHGVYPVAPVCLVNGREMQTADLYQHPTLSGLVSHEGPVKVIRYPSPVAPPKGPAHFREYVSPNYAVSAFPGYAELGLAAMRRGG